jgi:hypothetical protein
MTVCFRDLISLPEGPVEELRMWPQNKSGLYLSNFFKESSGFEGFWDFEPSD